MNGTLYQNPAFPSIEDGNIQTKDMSENIENNKGKQVKVYCNINNNEKEFEGRFEQFNKEYMVISNVKTNQHFLIPTKYINYVTCDEEIKI